MYPLRKWIADSPISRDPFVPAGGIVVSATPHTLNGSEIDIRSSPAQLRVAPATAIQAVPGDTDLPRESIETHDLFVTLARHPVVDPTRRQAKDYLTQPVQNQPSYDSSVHSVKGLASGATVLSTCIDRP